MLSVLTLAYSGTTIEEREMTGSPETQQRHVFETYGARMLQRRGSQAHYTQEQTKHWLTWLAWQLMWQNQTEFYLERMQPERLPNSRQRREYRIVNGPLFGLAYGGFAYIQHFVLRWFSLRRWSYAVDTQWFLCLSPRCIRPVKRDTSSERPMLWKSPERILPTALRAQEKEMEEKSIPLLLDIGGRRLAMRSQGNGVPTVVLEMGLGAPGSLFDALARQIATFTHVLWYDRAGLGRSDPAPTPRTIQDIVLDLHTLLQKAQITGPSVFAGHSMGGLVVRLYRERYPEQVAALVLIDASHEDQRERYLAVLPPQPHALPALAHLRHIWEVRWLDPNQNDEQIDNVANSELLHSCRSLGDLPLAVISRGGPTRDPAKYPPGLIEEMERTWRQMQRELTHLSSQSRQIIASRSGHMINEDEPALIVEVIGQMVMQVREQMKL